MQNDKDLNFKVPNFLNQYNNLIGTSYTPYGPSFMHWEMEWYQFLPAFQQNCI